MSITTMQETIITLTDKAAEHIQSCLSEHPAGSGLSIGVKKTGCSGYAYLLDIQPALREGQQLSLQSGIPLFITQEAIPFLQGTIMDFVSKGTGQKQLVFHNPNATGACGCGESFTVE